MRPVYPLPLLSHSSSVKCKQEKPLLKTHITGTDWLRISTTERNIFYFDKILKKSTWVVPGELKAALEVFEAEEKTAAEKFGKRKVDELATPHEVISKKAKLHDTQDSGAESEEEEWQFKAAEQLAAEAEEIRKAKEEEEKKQELQEAQRAFAENEIVMPRTVDLSIEEGKALFKVCCLVWDKAFY